MTAFSSQNEEDTSNEVQSSDASSTTTDQYRDSWASKMKDLNILFMKLSAACSKTQQASDVMPGFKILKQFFKNAQFRKFQAAQAPRPYFMDAWDLLLSKVPAASKRTFDQYIVALSWVVPVAYSKSNISQGYVKAGFIKSIARDGNSS